MNVITLPVGQLQTNCYVVVDRQTSKAFIIDPGDDADYIQRIITDEGVKPTQIIATHGHFDHILAVTELELAYKIPFSVHPKDEFLINSMQESARYFTGINPGPPPKISNSLKQGQKIALGKAQFTIIETPGHTPGSICLYCKTENVVFVGDLLFADGGVGRTDFSYSNTENLHHSLKMILTLPGKTVVLSGHGPETTISKEREYHKKSFSWSELLEKGR